jgi:hypothetical protein
MTEIKNSLQERNEQFKEWLDKMFVKFAGKNADYNDLFFRDKSLYEGYFNIRRKFNRIETLIGSPEKATGNIRGNDEESLDDTLLDLANYCIMTLVLKNNVMKIKG